MKKTLLATLIILSFTAPANAAGTTYKSLDDAIKVLKIADESRTGYVRDKFKHWVNIDGNKQGCDARKSAIIRDAIVKPTIGTGCTLTGGKWLSAYDNVTVEKAGSLDVDHMVPLAEAWDSGASAWSDNKRKAYANDLTDPRHLRSVTGPSNRSKSDQDPADWLPTNKTYLCQYLTDWVEIKVRWSLTIDQKELKALKDNSLKCPKVKIVIPALPAIS